MKVQALQLVRELIALYKLVRQVVSSSPIEKSPGFAAAPFAFAVNVIQFIVTVSPATIIAEVV
jgi:hypothetical protein